MSLSNDGLDEIYNKLNLLLDNNKKNIAAEKILLNFGIISQTRIRENFKNSVDSYGVTWTPLKAGGRRIKQGKKTYLDKSAKPLLDTGRLVGSISNRIIKSADSIGLEIYNADISGFANYGYFHQNGLGVTARPFLPTKELPKIWQQDLLKITDKIINNLLNS